jgi:hypothetical protein
MAFNNAVPTSQNPNYISITKIKWLMFYGEILVTDVYSEIHTDPTNTLWGQMHFHNFISGLKWILDK